MIMCATSTLFVNNDGFYFLTFDDRILGPSKDKAKLSNHEIMVRVTSFTFRTTFRSYLFAINKSQANLITFKVLN